MGHFAGLSGPSSHWRKEAVTAAACWLLTVVFGWWMRWCRALGGVRETIPITALRDPCLEKILRSKLLSYPTLPVSSIWRSVGR